MATKKIEKLTPEQEAYLPVFRDMWLKIGLDTTPVNPAMAREAIAELYRWGDLKVPEFIHMSSPMACELYLNLITNQAFMDELEGLLAGVNTENTNEVRSERCKYEASMNGMVRVPTWWEVLSQDESEDEKVLWGPWASIIDALIGNKLFITEGQAEIIQLNVLRMIRKHLKNTKLRYMGTWFNGNQDAYWVAFYLFGEYIGAEYQPKTRAGLAAWEKICKACHWFYPFREFCLISDKPEWIKRDDQGRLHDMKTMALRYRDGWGVFAVHGIRVEGRIITNPETITVKEIDDEQNAELRRIKIELYGHDRFLMDGGAKIRHQDKYGTLWEREIPNDETLVMIELINTTPEPDGTKKHYFQRVPPNMQRAKQAVAWANYLDEKDYDPKFES